MAQETREPLLQIRDAELNARLRSFCLATNRAIPATHRAVLQLFFAEGDGVASERLNRRLWDFIIRRRKKTNCRASPEAVAWAQQILSQANECPSARKIDR